MTNFPSESDHDVPPPVLSRRRIVDDSEMDITPMIDCTFLLLIFFLVCSRPDAQAAIQLAQAKYGVVVAAKEATVITIVESGRESPPVYLADGKVGEALPSDLEEQANKIQEAVEKAVQAGHTDVIIKAERGVQHRHVARVAAAASRVPGIKLFLGVTDSE